MLELERYRILTTFCPPTLYASGPQHLSPAGFHSGHPVRATPADARRKDLKSNNVGTEEQD